MSMACMECAGSGNLNFAVPLNKPLLQSGLSCFLGRNNSQFQFPVASYRAIVYNMGRGAKKGIRAAKLPRFGLGVVV